MPNPIPMLTVVVLGTVPLVPLHAADLTDDLVAHYTFDEDRDGDVFDESDHGNNGRVVGDVAYVPSFRGRAIRLSNHRMYVRSDAPGLNAYRWRQVTFSAWVKPERTTTYARIVTRGRIDGEKSGGFGLRLGNGRVKASWGVVTQYRGNDPFTERLNTSALQPNRRLNRWMRVVGTYDGTFLRMYVDGERLGEVEVRSHGLHLWDREDMSLVIGNAATRSRLSWTDKYFHGLIDEVRIWKRGLTEAEVVRLYEADRAVVKAE